MAGLTKSGEEKAISSLEGAASRVGLGLRDGGNMVGNMLVRETQRGMRDGPQSGRVYPRLKRQSSAPGEYPAIQSGQLVGSIGHEMHGDHQLIFGSRGAFNGGFDYAIGQHEGTSKMGPRPYLTLTVNKMQGQIQARLGQVVWQKLIGGA